MFHIYSEGMYILLSLVISTIDVRAGLFIALSSTLKLLFYCFGACVLKKNLLFSSLFFYMKCIFFHLESFKIFFSLPLVSNFCMSLSVVFFKLLLLAILRASWICGFIVLIKCGRFRPSFPQIFFYPVSFCPSLRLQLNLHTAA